MNVRRFCVLALTGAVFSIPLGAQEIHTFRPGTDPVDLPDFTAFEVEYGSAFGRFFNQVRPFELDGRPMISVLNIIDMPGMVIVDSKGIDRATLRLEYFMSPYFAWGQEYVVAQADGDAFEWVRIPIGGGEPMRQHGPAEFGGYTDDLGFSPTLAGLLPLPVGTRFRLPAFQPREGGSVASVLVEYAVTGRETVTLPDGTSCACWVVDQTDAAGAVHRFWVAREAPFVFRRRRDVGGPRDFTSEVLSFRVY